MHLLQSVVHRTLPLEVKEERKQFLIPIDEFRQLVVVAILEGVLQLCVTVMDRKVVKQVLVMIAQYRRQDPRQLVIGNWHLALYYTLTNHSVPDVCLIEVKQLEHRLLSERILPVQFRFKNVVWVVN